VSLGPLLVDLRGARLEPGERELLGHPAVAGVVLFARNYEEPGQLAALTAEIRGLREPALLIAVDHEGGRVQRFREPFTPLPAPGRIGALYERQPDRALALARTAGQVAARELRAVGVDFSFAPVLDLGTCNHTAIGDRAFHRDPQVVAELARAWMSGARAEGMASVGKHFPGHGGAREDSHRCTPCDRRDLASIALADLLVFERLVHYGIPALMSAHVRFPAVDALPATFSRRWLCDELRIRIGFRGALFSDDLAMAGAGVVDGPAARVEAALAAGCDCALLCNRAEALAEVVAALDPRAGSALRGARLAALRGRGRPRGLAEVQAGAGHAEQAGALLALEPEPELALGDDR